MPSMPKRRPSHVHKQLARNGETIWYHRIGKGKRTRLWERYGTAAFMAEVAAAEAGTPMPRAPVTRGGQGSFSWGIRLYRASRAWMGLSEATRKQRGNIFDRLLRTPAAEAAIYDLTRKNLKTKLASMADTPAAARHYLQTLRGFFAWIVDEDITPIKEDPTTGVIIKAPASDGFPPWTAEDCAAYEARWPIGTRERVAYAVIAWTGLRRGDAVRVGLPHVRDGIIRIKTEKTGAWVAIVIEPELEEVLAAGPCGDLTFIAGERGRPRVKESFGEWFRQACHAAGVHKSAHGLRKTRATLDAEDGYTEAELEAKNGWARGGRMAAHYTQSIDRERVSIAAAKKRTIR